jgi:hypothetical protein
MGRVTDDRAVVYTQAGPDRLEETWVREPDGWRLRRVKVLGTDTGAAAAR